MARPEAPERALPEAELVAMAENCREAAARLRRSERPADQVDAAAFEAVAKLHDQAAHAARRPRYWWGDRD